MSEVGTNVSSSFEPPIFDAEHTITHNEANRVASIQEGGTTASFKYNGDGQRAVRTVGTNTTRYAFALGSWELLTEKTNAGPYRDYVWLPDGTPLAVVDGQNVHYVHTDHLGTPLFVTNAGAVVVWKHHPVPFGPGHVDEDPDTDGQPFSLSLRYPGQYADEDVRFWYNYFRWYDPIVGRYITSDPIGLVGGFNTYLYANANPVLFVDPLGLDPYRCGPGMIEERLGHNSYKCTPIKGYKWTAEDARKALDDARSTCAECSAGLQFPLPIDVRSEQEVTEGQCRWTCSLATGIGAAPLPFVTGTGITGSAVSFGARYSFCRWVCEEDQCR